MRDQRPKNLNLFTIRFPVTAIVSILHRVSGIILFLLIPVLLWGLKLSLASSQDFDSVRQFFTTPCMKLMLGCLLAAFVYHFVAGIRHLLMDMGIGETLKSGRLAAWLTFLISFVLIVLLGIWLW